MDYSVDVYLWREEDTQSTEKPIQIHTVWWEHKDISYTDTSTLFYSQSVSFTELFQTWQRTGQMICLNNWQPAKDSWGDNAPSVAADQN